MAGTKFDSHIELNGNQILNYILEKFDNLTLPSPGAEGRFGYHIIKKLPTFHNGLGFEFLVTENYVNALLGGLAWKDEVKVASGTNIALASLVDSVVVDDITLHTGDRVLLFGQTDARENGVWLVGATAERPYDLDESGDFNNAVIPVKEGTTYAGWQFRCTNVDPDIGIDELEFKDMTPTVPDASETVKGKIRIALPAAVVLGAEGDTAVTPATLKLLLDPIRTQIGAIAPDPPAGLTGRSLSMTLYTALQASTGSTHQCTDDTTPSGSIANFYDGDAGTLSAEIDSVEDGSHVLSTASDIGVYDSMHITDDSDPYPIGEMGHGLYKQLSAYIESTIALSLGSHTYKLIHSLTGETNLLTFWVDNPAAVTVSGISATLPAISRWVSGVPSLATGDVIHVNFTVNDAVKKHYNQTRVARVQGVQTQSIDYAPPVTPPAENDPIAFANEEILVLTGAYSENAQMSIYGYNSKSVAGAAGTLNTNSRIDTMSVETRKEAGSGLYPAAGYGGAYDSTQSLKTYYTEELQLLNGKYQFPGGNYSGNLPTAGPDYSAGMGAGDRWVLFDLGINLNSASSFVINLPNTEGTWTGVETVGIKIQVKVEGVTGWLDANKAYSLVGSPVADGDAAMVFGDSTTTSKKVSFGPTPRSGLLLIRIALPAGSDKKFGQGVNVTNIS